MADSLADALPAELKRARELLAMYHEIGPAGLFGAHVIEDVIGRADRAVMSGDVVAMIRVYEELRELK